MKLLAIDTALSACSAAIIDMSADAEPLSEQSRPMVRGHAEALMPMLEDMLRQAGLVLSDIDRFAVTVGPGSFTGVRVGVSVARGFALVTGKPAMGVSTLTALAQTARDASLTSNLPFLVAIDARRGEIYAQAFDQGGEPLGEAVAAPAELIVSELPDAVHLIFGSGAELARAAAEPIGRRLDIVGQDGAPRPAAVGRAASRPWAALPPSPLYLRPPDAKPQEGAALARR